MTDRPWLQQYSPYVPHQLPIPTRSMIDIVEAVAHDTPEAAAIQHFDQTISYGRLDELSTRFAALLAKAGVGKGDRVAVSLQSDPEFVVAEYGAWKRGAIFVPLNPMFKQREIEYHLADSGARFYVCRREIYEAHARAVLPNTSVERALTDAEFFDAIEAERADPAARIEVTTDDIAHLVYTSGTTGNPKGAIGLHRSIAFNAEVFRRWMQLGAEDSVLGAAPLFHITGLVAEIAAAAIAGIPLILFHRFDPREAVRMIERWRPTFMVAAITAYIALMNEGPADLSSLKKCYSGGAPVAPSIVEKFEQQFGVYIHNIYGLTESNSPSHATPYSARAPVDSASGALSIGVPVPNCEARIVDLTDPSREVAAGETGELAMRGPMMFAGYWNKPEATEAAFHDGWFLTGDVATRDAEGWFYLVDRKKDMIVASGYKVWPREVEDVLYQHPAVREAAVVGVPDEYRGETVKAFIAPKPDVRVTAEEIIEFCRERMAAYKYPRQVEFVAEIPKTATGKFMRRALKAPGA